ncbi:hypothetical protein [Microbacterium sp. 2FI]|uniref:hypothetical protein n=1 Tax=Microbacterium sp. 2FI TaxID=2502193 RepID=UPI0010F829FA|nr:hypothetical protein [Microbacterium sp. 2FI]
MTERVRTSPDVAALAERILARRQRPLVVVSTDPHTDLFALDTDELAGELRDIADLVLISTGDLTRELDSLLPEKTQVYGGAGRSYPVDFGVQPDWRRSPLRFPGGRATQQLIGDALGQAGAAGLFDKPSVRRLAASGVVKGFVADDTRAVVDLDGRGLATISRELTYPPIPLDWSLHRGQRVAGVLDLDTRLLLVEESTPTQAALEAAFPHGCVTLALVRKVSPARATLLLHPAVEIVLRRIDVSPNPLDTVDLLVAEGDVVAARVTHLSDGTLHLALTDVDDDEPVVPPLALTSGGRPWLEEGRTLELHTTDAAGDLAALNEAAAASTRAGDARSPVDAAAIPAAPSTLADPGAVAAASIPPDVQAERPMPGPGRRRVESVPVEATATSAAAAVVAQLEGGVGDASAPAAGAALRSTQLQLQSERARSAELERRLAEVGVDDSGLGRLRARVIGAEARLREELAERGELERQLKELKAQQLATTRAVRESRRAAPAVVPVASVDDRRSRWVDDEQWVRHEVYLAWVERVEPGERERWAIGEYDVGPEFVASLASLTIGHFDKAMKAVVDAVTGRIRDVPSRGVHALRSGDGAGDPDLVRSDGAKCYRAYIEQNAAAARRLHYWALAGGAVELSRVVTHDDVRP